MHACMQACMHVCTCVHMYVYVCMYECMHLHEHLCKQKACICVFVHVINFVDEYVMLVYVPVLMCAGRYLNLLQQSINQLDEEIDVAYLQLHLLGALNTRHACIVYAARSYPCSHPFIFMTRKLASTSRSYSCYSKELDGRSVSCAVFKSRISGLFVVFDWFLSHWLALSQSWHELAYGQMLIH